MDASESVSSATDAVSVTQPQIRSTAISGLFGLAFLYTLYFAADLLIPVTAAILVNITFSPMVRTLAKHRIPRGFSAACIVGTLVLVTALGIGALAAPAEQWLSDAPRSMRDLKRQLLPAKGHLADIQELAEQVDDLTTVAPDNSAQTVVVQGPGVLENLVGGLPTILASASVVVFLSFFLLASGDHMLRRLTQCGRTWTERRRIVAVARHIQSDISRYLVTVAVLNILLGVAVAVVMKLLDVPNPLLWGTLVGILNFAPYIGAIVSAILLTLVGFTTFSDLTQALTVPGAFLLLSILEGQIITPMTIGHRLSLTPTVVFVSVLVWGWLWGIAGALMAVPIVTSIKVLCTHFPRLNFLGTFLRRDADDNAAVTAGRFPTRVAALPGGLFRRPRRPVGRA